MQKALFSLVLLCVVCPAHTFGQQTQTNTRTHQAPPTTLEERRERRQNRVVKEWNTEGKRRWLDFIKIYDPEGRVIESIEYASYGQKERVTSEYDKDGKCIREVVYNDKNRVVRIRKFEYNPDGTKKIQYNYLPNGKLYSTKIFEYSYR